ncbi:MAG: HEAT repeat domain-containing protein [Candidatus Lokiarchaeota archaeon]
MDYKEGFEDSNWHLIELSKVNDKIISDLVKNINSEISEEFFISFESLIKISKEKTHLIKSAVDRIKETEDFREIILNYLLKSYNDSIDDKIILKLYNHDFIVRARTIMELTESRNLDYIKFILPLLNDPDDSVRWAVLKFIIENNLCENENIIKKLIERKKCEGNLIIKRKIQSILKSDPPKF